MSTGPDAYTHGHHESVLRSHRWRTAANSAGYLLPRLRPGTALLDVGCGPGTITADLAHRVEPARVTAVEISHDALTLARAEAQRQQLRNVEFVVADVFDLPFSDDTFDVVHAHQVLQHLDDPVGALREMRRVCKPGGTVAARDGDYAGFLWFPAVSGLEEWLTLYDRLARADGGEPNAGRHLLAWAHSAGFADVTATASVWCFATPEDRAWWGGLWADRVVASRFAERAVASGVRTEQLEKVALAWRHWARHDDGWFLVPHGEVLARA